MTAAVLGLVSALLTVYAAAITVRAARAAEGRDELAGTVTSLERQRDSLQRQLTTTEGELQVVTQERDKLLRQQGDNDEGGTAEPSSNDAIYHEGPLVATGYMFVDLDAPSDDPQWDTLKQQGNWDVHADYTRLKGEQLLKVAATDDPATVCKESTGYAQQEIPYRSLNGAAVCVATDESRFSYLELQKYDSDAGQATFSVVTFRNSQD